MVKYRTKRSQNQNLSWNQNIATAAELFFSANSEGFIQP